MCQAGLMSYFTQIICLAVPLFTGIMLNELLSMCVTLYPVPMPALVQNTATSSHGITVSYPSCLTSSKKRVVNAIHLSANIVFAYKGSEYLGDFLQSQYYTVSIPSNVVSMKVSFFILLVSIFL